MVHINRTNEKTNVVMLYKSIKLSKKYPNIEIMIGTK